MKEKIIRVAQVMGKMNNGGVEAVVLNYYRAIDRTKIQFDFIVDETSSCPHKEEIEKMGGRIIFVPPYSHIFKYKNALKKVFLDNKYKIVHSHLTTLNVLPLKVAKKCGIGVRISHAHSTAGKGELIRNSIKYMLRPFSKVYPTHLFACGKYAGEWLYGKKAFREGKIRIVKNAIHSGLFTYNYEKRVSIRSSLGIKDGQIVFGHIGRFVPQKNHKFLIKVFKGIHDSDKQSVLILIGEGPLKEKIREMVESFKLSDSVIFLGSKSNTCDFYNSFDCFLLPSTYEGLPVVGIEAQFNGLACLFSDKMTDEILINDNVFSRPLSISNWANMPSFDRVNPNLDKLKYYEIKEAADSLADFYLSNV